MTPPDAVNSGPSRTLRSIFWAGAETASLALTSFLVLVVLARYLTAAEFGVASLALAVVQIGGAIVEVLFHDALVQRKELYPAQIGAAHTISVGLGIIVSVSAALAAPFYAAWVNAPQSAVFLLWLAPSVALTSLTAVPLALMRRDLDFRSVALRTLGGRLAGAVAGVIAAIAGYGGWSLVIQQNVMVAVSTAAVFILGRRYWPGFAAPRGAGPLLSFAGASLALNLLWGNIAKSFTIFAGALLPARMVGEIALAMRIVDMLASIVAGALNKVALPLFSRLRRAGEDLTQAYVTAAKNTALLTMPLFAGLALVSHELILLIAGREWLPAADLLTVFALAQMLRAMFYPASPLLTAIGALRANLFIAVSELIVMLVALWYLRNGEAWAWRLAATVPLSVLMLARCAGIGLRASLGSVLHAALASAIMSACVLCLRMADISGGALVSLGMSAALGALTFVCALVAIERGRADGLYALMKNILAR